MKDKEFERAINEIKNMKIVKHLHEPVILKHDKDTSSFNKIKEKEVMKIFNNVYNGENEYRIEDIRKELIYVDAVF